MLVFKQGAATGAIAPYQHNNGAMSPSDVGEASRLGDLQSMLDEERRRLWWLAQVYIYLSMSRP